MDDWGFAHGKKEHRGVTGAGNAAPGHKSPLEDERTLWQKAKDEAGQIWQGAKALVTAEHGGIDKMQRAYLKQEQKDRGDA